MEKKCFLCNSNAEYMIKNSTNYYCQNCAKDFFSDLSMLLKVETQVKNLKKVLDKKIKLNKKGKIVSSDE